MSRTTLAGVPHYLRRLAAPTDVGDAELLGRFIAGRDEAAFRGLVDRHGPMVWGVCSRALRNPADAEEAFQATFFVLARKADRIAGRERLANWLYGVARRAALKVREAARRRPEVQVGSAPEPPAPGRPRSADLTDAVDEALDRLPTQEREVLVLCHLQDRTHEQAAAALGCSVSTVRRRLADGADRLRARLAGVGVAAGGFTLPRATALPPGLADRTVAGVLDAAAGAVATGPAAVAAEVVRTLPGGPFRLGPVLTLAAASLAIGVLLVGSPAEPAKPTPPRPASAGPPRTDHLGDPLPDGAVARIGTYRFQTAGRATVGDLAFLPDGRSVATVGGDGKVRFWDLPGGRETGVIDGPTGACCVAASADGRRLVAGGWDEVWGWELTPVGPKPAWKRPADPHVYAVAISPDGRLAAASNQFGREVRLFDAATGEPSRTLTAPAQKPPPGVTRLAFSADGKTLYAGREAGPTRAWDVATGKDRPAAADPAELLTVRLVPAWGGKPVAEDTLFLPFLVGPGPGGENPAAELVHPARLKRVGGKRLSPDGKTFAAVSGGQLYAWEVATGRPLGPDGRLPGGVVGLDLSADGKRVVTLTGENEVRVWDADTGRPGRRLIPGNARVWLTAARFRPDGGVDTYHYRPDATPARFLNRWDVTSGTAVEVAVPGLTPHTSALVVGSPDGQRAAVLMGDRFAFHEAGQEPRVLPVGGSILTLEYAADSRSVVVATMAGTVEVWGVDGTRRLAAVVRPAVVLVGEEPPPPPPPPPAVSADGTVTAVVVDRAAGSEIELLSTNAPPRRFPAPKAKVVRLAFDPAGRRLAAGAEDGTTTVWAVPTGRVARTLAGHRAAVTAVAFTPDGRRLVTGSADGTGLVWDVSDPGPKD